MATFTTKTLKDGLDANFTQRYADFGSTQLGPVVAYRAVKGDGTEVDPVAQVARGTADAGEPLKTGGPGTVSLAGKTPVSDGQRVDSEHSIEGKQFVTEAAGADRLDGLVQITNSTTAQAAIPAQGAGIRTIVTGIMIDNEHSAKVSVELRDGTTVKAQLSSGLTGANYTHHFRGSTNTAWNVRITSAVAGQVSVTLVGYATRD